MFQVYCMTAALHVNTQIDCGDSQAESVAETESMCECVLATCRLFVFSCNSYRTISQMTNMPKWLEP